MGCLRALKEAASTNRRRFARHRERSEAIQEPEAQRQYLDRHGTFRASR